MKKKTRKELEAMVDMLEKKLSSQNVLFSLYVKFKGAGITFQQFLANEMKNA